jgi:hypothetical protein
LLGVLASATGGSHGVISAQAMELEQSLDEDAAHHLATVALLRAAGIGGAIIGGGDDETTGWARIGELVAQAVRVHDGGGLLAVTRAEIIAALQELRGASTPESEAIQRLFEDAT